MPDDDGPPPPPWDDEHMRDALRRFLAGEEGFDPMDLMRAAGIDVSSEEISGVISALQSAIGPHGTLNPHAAKDRAMAVAKEGSESIDPATAQAISQAASVASLWLGEVTDIAELSDPPVVATRVDWARTSFPVWDEMTGPVSQAIPRAMTGLLANHAPDEIQELMAGAQDAMERVARSLFGLQLAQVVGSLSREVLSGGDIGIPLIHGSSEYDVLAVLIPQNIRAFSTDLDVPTEEADLFVAVREIAHARLFRHARWLRLHVMSVIGDFASGIAIDGSRIMELAEEFDPANPEAMRDLIASGRLLPERTEEQQRALQRLETVLALVEGWVDHVTTRATTRLPKASALAETVRRRRASGGPAERAFQTLVGLELRPRKLREASALWDAIEEAIGPEARDELWRHPDTLPTEADFDDPASYLARLQNPSPANDEMDEALRDLLESEGGAD